MPIKGLTDRGLSFPEIGQVRKGGKKTDPRRPGPDLTYFRVAFDEREAEAATTFRKIYGDKPTEINIILPFNEIERMWDAYLEAYTAGRMVARSDGEIFTYLVDTRTGEILVKSGIDIKTGQPRPYIDGRPVGTWRNQKTGKDEPIFCKPTGRLKVVIPELGRAAYLTVMTTSVHDIANISAQLTAFQQVNGGRIAGIPLVLRRRPKMISTPSPDGGRARREKWLLSIEADPTWVKRMLTEVKRLALPGNGLPLPALPSGVHDDDPVEDYGDYEDESEEFDEAEEEMGQADNVIDGQYTQKNNGNGYTKTPLELALERQTKRGTRFSELNDEQLRFIVTSSSVADERAAAKLILDELFTEPEQPEQPEVTE